MGKWLVVVVLVFSACFIFSCKKDKPADPVVVTPKTALYADSIFYIQASDNIVKPLNTAAGLYTCIPDGLELDANTGAININKSETGLKYRVTFTPSGNGAVVTSYIVISGINYYDKIFNLSAGDSIAAPIYNADSKSALPNSNNGNVFDQGNGCKNAGIVVDPQNAKINLALSVRKQGIDTGATQEVKLAYRINDNSNKTLNGLNVKIYFYRTASEIPQYLSDLLAQRKGTIFTTNTLSPFHQASLAASYSFAAAPKTARPRPPCIIVVSR